MHNSGYSAPLYFERNRRPVEMSPKMDARTEQELRDPDETPRLAQVTDTGESFFLWDYGSVAGHDHARDGRPGGLAVD